MAQELIFIFVLVFAVFFMIRAWFAEDRAHGAMVKYNRLKKQLDQLEFELAPRFKGNDPEFLAGYNMAMGRAKMMIGRVRDDA